MDLRSGAITQEFQKQKKTKKERRKSTNKPEVSMASDTSLERNLKEMLTSFKEDISAQIGELRHDFEKFSTEIKEIRGDMKNVCAEVGTVKEGLLEAEERLHQLEEREIALNEVVLHLTQQQRLLNEQLDQWDTRARKNNIRIYKVQEGAEGGDLMGFINQLLVEKLHLTAETFKISAAYRSSSRNKPTQENPGPRSIVVVFENWEMRQKVLQAAWTKKEITLGETRIFFSQDFTRKTQIDRSRYNPLRKLLKDKNVKNHLTFPAKLKVFVDGGETITYEEPEDAEDQLRQKGVISQADKRIYTRRMGSLPLTNAPFQRVKTQRGNACRERMSPPEETTALDA